MSFSDAFRANCEALGCLSLLMFSDCCVFSAFELFVIGGVGDGICMCMCVYVSFIAGKCDGIISVPVSRSLLLLLIYFSYATDRENITSLLNILFC